MDLVFFSFDDMKMFSLEEWGEGEQKERNSDRDYLSTLSLPCCKELHLGANEGHEASSLSLPGPSLAVMEGR